MKFFSLRLCICSILITSILGCNLNNPNNEKSSDYLSDNYIENNIIDNDANLKQNNTIDYQKLKENYLSDEVVYYTVENNVVYRCKSEKTKCYSVNATLEEMEIITNEIKAETADAIGCDTTDENYQFLLADYKVSYAIHNGKLYRYFYEEDYLEVIYENEKLCYAQFYTNKCITISLYSKKWYDYIDEITSLGYKSYTEAYDDDYYFYGNPIGDVITIDLITGEETLLEGRTDVVGDPYSEIDGDFPGLITIE